jgi:hypothetical protein
VAGAVILLDAMGPSTPAEGAAGNHSFNLVAWEVRHLPEKWLYQAGSLFRDDGGETDEEAVRRYFELLAEIAALETDDPRLEQAQQERSLLENRVEAIIEGRVAAVLRNEGLTMGPPPFTEMEIIFPPVDFEFESPPRVLAVSERDRIALRDDYLLQPGLNREVAEEIEAEAESDGETSALVAQAGGVATYPSMIAGNKQYEDLVDVVFHEWLHQHLVFYPLGRSYFANSRTRTLNESIASIGARELAEQYFARYPRLQPERPPSPAAGLSNDFDFTAEMRALRMQVEEMLEAGRVEQAEALMNEKRDEFEEKGAFVRRINQAYFAFHGFYADSPGSIDPIGPKLEALFQAAGSPGDFVRSLYGVTSEGELDRLIASDDGDRR